MVHVDRWSKRRSLSRDCDRLISDAEAFLSGDYENHVRRHDRRVPGWARLNRFAHGDLRIVRRARRPFAATKSAAFADWPEEAWRSAQRIVASELLALVGDSPGLLLQLQRSVLVPLELELIGAEAKSHLTALELVQVTRLALRRCAPELSGDGGDGDVDQRRDTEVEDPTPRRRASGPPQTGPVISVNVETASPGPSGVQPTSRRKKMSDG